ncbi:MULTISPECIES: hypothetical protein [unclassified Sphingobium]|uniref:hypothetical protein n=1 Tax=unclassified Sphingobium TaxID=2611147 RepID=UPI0012ED8C40|nr:MULTISPECIES: hypothetical protein [unclassified Sphingobium]
MHDKIGRIEPMPAVPEVIIPQSLRSKLLIFCGSVARDIFFPTSAAEARSLIRGEV